MREEVRTRVEEPGTSDDETVVVIQDGVALNAAGHRDQLSRQYGLLGLASMALTVDNAWVALGSSISVSIRINFYGWIFALASLMQISSNVAVSMYAVYHLDTYVSQPYHVFIGYLLILWGSAFFIVFANKYAPHTQHVGTFFVIVGGIVTIIILAAMPKRHATNHFVWSSFNENNATGWSGGVAFLLGVLNGAFTIGTPDSVTHMAEEMGHPRKDLPKAIMLQITLGFVYITALQGGFNTFPLTNIYVQATAGDNGVRNPGAAFGLLFIMLICTLTCCVGLTLTVSRTYWALARDNAVPLSALFGRVNERLSCPVWSTLFVCVLATGIGAIPLGSSTAFLAIAGSFVVLTTISYAIPFAANMLSGRKYFPKGPFHLGRAGYAVNGLAVLFIVLFDVLFCFRTVAITGLWWAAHAVKHYPGPKVMALYIETDGVAPVATEKSSASAMATELKQKEAENLRS
ncbi:hypothetical protein COL26b_003791 [Colletotrichum chrysophilum]|uniref:uncharacterized protein n=1 Tax=Colletotrichum chrysophilum TaxID=1836956 RepID=UPI002300EC18|nr:uncharacterized protein COL26b_003791 [Colletotrichum chrysophilum]KAJ0377878.1 hypothetical protein COL26b_003791 [Colletotrichum chrysophilum]